MKNLKDIINEKLVINKNIKINKYNYYPQDAKELKELVYKLIKERGNDADLNDIDTSKITNMDELFRLNDYKETTLSNFNGDISEWDVSKVRDMSFMFDGSKFNGDISKWDVSNVTDMRYMFSRSYFNGDISRWDVSKVKNMSFMFDDSHFTGANGDISNWNVSNVEDMKCMFRDSNFFGNISKWDISNVKYGKDIFKRAPSNIKKPKLYKTIKDIDY